MTKPLLMSKIVGPPDDASAPAAAMPAFAIRRSASTSAAGGVTTVTKWQASARRKVLKPGAANHMVRKWPTRERCKVGEGHAAVGLNAPRDALTATA